MVTKFSMAAGTARNGQAAPSLFVGLAAQIAHGVVTTVGIALSGYRLADLRSRGRAVVFLQTSKAGQMIGRAIRWLFLPLLALTAWMEFQPVDHRAEVLRVINAILFGLLALTGPLAVAALSYRRWVTILLALAGLAEILQISPDIPGSADVADFLATAFAVLILTGLGLYLQWFGRQDFEDTALWARPWVESSPRHISNAAPR